MCERSAARQIEPETMRLVPVSCLRILCLYCCFSMGGALAQTPLNNAPSNDAAILVELEGAVEVSRSKAEIWDHAYTNQVLYPGDRLRTLERSRAVLRVSGVGSLRVGEL